MVRARARVRVRVRVRVRARVTVLLNSPYYSKAGKKKHSRRVVLCRLHFKSDKYTDRKFNKQTWKPLLS